MKIFTFNRKYFQLPREAVFHHPISIQYNFNEQQIPVNKYVLVNASGNENPYYPQYDEEEKKESNVLTAFV